MKHSYLNKSINQNPIRLYSKCLGTLFLKSETNKNDANNHHFYSKFNWQSSPIKKEKKQINIGHKGD